MDLPILSIVSRYLIFLFAFLLAACANQASPTGGPKDEDPPLLVSSIPYNNAINYKGNTLQFEFNENIALNKPYQEILIVPTVGKNVKFRTKRNMLLIELEDGWADSTTYSISIRNGVKDLTEGNSPKNVKIAFSSGPFIDSLFIAGKVHYALKETFPKDKIITVAIHSSDTFDIFDDTPKYFTETDNKGKFRLENIKSGTYKIYAFEDVSHSLTVQSKTEPYGFLAEPIVLDSESDSIMMTITLLDSRKPTINAIRNNGLYTKILFNKSIHKYKLECDSSTSIIHSFGDSQSEIIIYNPKAIHDSIRFTLRANDKLNLQVDSIFYIKEKTLASNFLADDFTVTIKEINVETESNEFIATIAISKPLQSFDYDSILIPIDSSKAINFNEKDFTYDSIYKEVTITKNIATYIEKDSLFISYIPYLFLGQGAIMSIEGDTSKVIKKIIPYTKAKETGTLLVEVQSKKPHYQIQLLSKKGDIIKSVHDALKHSFKGLPVQDYQIRVIIDNNNNSEWDAGNIYKNREPEPIYFYKTIDGKYTFPIRANWELGPFMLKF